MALIVPPYTVYPHLSQLAQMQVDGYRSMRGGGRIMCIKLPGNMTFAAGSPRVFRHGHYEVQVFRGEVNHFHTWDDGSRVPRGWDSNEGLAVAYRYDRWGMHRMSAGRKALRAYLAAHPPVDVQVQAFELRRMVRPGD